MAIAALTGTGNVTSAAVNAGTSITINKPSNTADNDYLVAGLHTRAATVPFPTPPSGWTAVAPTGTETTSIGVLRYYYRKITSASGEPSSYTWSGTTSGRLTGIIFRVTGADMNNPIDVAGGNATATSGPTQLILPAVTTAGVNRLLLGMVDTNISAGQTRGSMTQPGGMTRIGQVGTTTGGSETDFAMDYESLTSSGSTGTRTYTQATTIASAFGYLLTMIPPTVTLTAGTAFQATGSVTSGTVSLPSGLVASDYTFLFCTLNASSGVITGPSGWSTAFASAQSTASSSHAMAIYYRAWQSGDADPVVTCTSGRLAVLPVKVSSADTTNPIEGTVGSTTQGSATTSVDAPSQTSTLSKLLVTVHSGRSATNGTFITWTPNSGMTETGEAGGQAAAATNASIEVCWEIIAAGATTGTRTSTASSTATGSRGVSMLLLAAGTAATVTGSATFAATAGLSSDGSVQEVAGATLAATAGLSAAGSVQEVAGAALSATAVLSGSGTATQVAAAVLGASAGLSASALVEALGAAVLGVTAGFLASAGDFLSGSANLLSVAGLSADGSLHAVASADLAVGAGLAATGDATLLSSADLAVTAGLLAGGALTTFGEVSLETSASLLAAGAIILLGDAAMLVGASLEAQGFLASELVRVLNPRLALGNRPGSLYVPPVDGKLLLEGT